MCLRDQRQLVQALAAFERAIALAPASIAAREELSDLYAAQGRHAEQVEQLQVLAALDRDHVERQVALGLAQAHADHWDLAVLTLSAALDRSPNEPLLYCALGQVWLERPREKNDRVFLGKAREALERVASQPGATSAALLLYGRALLQQGDLEGAEQALHDATRRYPLAPAALTEYASLAERQSHLDPARTALVEYDALAGSDADASSRAAHIGALSLRLNDARGAIVWLKRATELAPGDARGFAALADAQLRAGDRAGADATTTRGLEKDPGNAALQALARRIHPA
jgi:tetratricopeptide (TPR) repeat protein